MRDKSEWGYIGWMLNLITFGWWGKRILKDQSLCTTCGKQVHGMYLEMDNGDDTQVWYFCIDCTRKQFGNNREMMQALMELEDRDEEDFKNY